MENIFEKKSHWIWTTDWDEIDQSRSKFVFFRNTLTLQKVPIKAIIRVSADSRYRFFVNGVSVAFGPCKSDHQIWYYEEVDITSLLYEGTNILSAIVLKYPTSHGRGNQSVWRTDIPGLFFEGELDFDSNSRRYLKADETWKTYKSNRIEILPESQGLNYLWIFEKAQGDITLIGWKEEDYDESHWHDAVVYPFLQIKQAVSPGNLEKRPIPPMFENEKKFKETICLRQSTLIANHWNEWLVNEKSLLLQENSRHIIEIDAGELTTGFLQFGFRSGKGASVKIISAEAYVYADEAISTLDLSVRKGNRMDYELGRLLGYEDFYEVGGFGTREVQETYEPFWFRTFRFIKLEINTQGESLELVRFSYRETGYPIDVRTWVETSDESLRGVWDISLRSLRRCMHETYEDCPFFEQLQYAMDTRSQILYTYSVSADDRLARKAIDEFHRSLRYDGTINCCYPSYEPNVIPGFSLYYVLMIYDHMMYFGDELLVQRYMPTVEAIFDFFIRAIGQDGLVGKVGDPLFAGKYWSFVDWAKDWNDTLGVPSAIQYGSITLESLLFVSLLEHGARMAEFIRREELASRYRTLAEELKRSIRNSCIGRNGMIQDGPGVDEYSQHAQVWAVLADVVTGDEAKRLIQLALSEEALTKCSVAMAYYLFRAVEKVGLYEHTRSLWEPWHEMLRMNLTTCVEDPVTARSDCHAWGSLILYELPAVVLGVRPLKPGFEEIEICPIPGYLDWAKGEVITPKGLIKVSWKRVEGQIEVEYQLPGDINWRKETRHIS